MRRALLLLALCGCASGGTPGEEVTAHPSVIYSGPETGTLLTDRPRSVELTISAPPVAVWTAVKKVYSDFEIPMTVENPSTHLLGNPSFNKSRQLGGRPMVDFVDCGSNMTGLKAAAYRITISLLTTVTADGKGGTDVRTTFVPIGQDISGNSADRIPCGTTGRFEQYFLDQVKAALGK